MNVRNCRNCGRIFNYVVGPIICPSCRDELEKKFQEVKEYIREHKNAGIQQVAEECDVSTNQIHHWLREERLEIVEGSSITLNCEKCGAMILSGRFCEKCKHEMTSGLQNAFRSESNSGVQEPRKSLKESPKMRFLERE